MPEKGIRNYKAIAVDVAEGFVTVNPIFLKSFDEEGIKSLYKAIERKQSEIRAEPFPHHDVVLIRKRNLRLQRLYSSLMIIKAFAKERRLSIF